MLPGHTYKEYTTLLTKLADAAEQLPSATAEVSLSSRSMEDIARGDASFSLADAATMYIGPPTKADMIYAIKACRDLVGSAALTMERVIASDFADSSYVTKDAHTRVVHMLLGAGLSVAHTWVSEYFPSLTSAAAILEKLPVNPYDHMYRVFITRAPAPTERAIYNGGDPVVRDLFSRRSDSPGPQWTSDISAEMMEHCLAQLCEGLDRVNYAAHTRDDPAWRWSVDLLFRVTELLQSGRIASPPPGSVAWLYAECASHYVDEAVRSLTLPDPNTMS